MICVECRRVAPVNWSMVRQLIVFGDCGVWMVSDLMMLELRVMSASVFATGMVRAWVLMLELESACCSCEVHAAQRMLVGSIHVHVEVDDDGVMDN